MLKTRRILGLLLVLGLFGPSIALANMRLYRHDGYIYQEVWWREHRSEPHTVLLLHFGPRQDHDWLAAGNARLEQKESQVVFDDQAVDDLFGLAGGSDMPTMGSELRQRSSRKMGRDPEAQAPPDVIYDYSPNHGVFKLPAGAKRTDEGKFGQGLRLTGKRGVMMRIGPKGPFGSKGNQRIAAMEGWFKPEGLPEETVCLMACQDGASLLLHPDGRVELTWDSKHTGERARLISDEPIQPNQWTHLVAHIWLGKHIEGKQFNHQLRLLVNGRISAFVERGHGANTNRIDHLFPRGRFSLGGDLQGERAFRGWVDDVRLGGVRRYNPRAVEPWLDPQAERPLVLGSPHFPEDGVIFYASLDQLALDISHPPGQRIGWDLSPEDFAKQQFPGVRGQALAIDPAMGFPRIPIKNLDFNGTGSLELWYQPMNWDNHTDQADVVWSFHRHLVILARLYGRDRRTGEVVQFGDIHTTRSAIHGNPDWYEPGQWNHLVWRWDRNNEYDEKRSGLKARRFGKLSWRMILQRNMELLPHVEPLYIEFGIDNTAENQDVQGLHDQRPGILIDEVVGYNYRMSDEQIERALKRWKGELSPPSE